jgi:ankyrin repeat protein
LFAWKYPKGDPLSRQLSGLLASSPSYFRDTSRIRPSLPDLSRESAPSSITNAGLHVQLRLRPVHANIGGSSPRSWYASPNPGGDEHTDYVAILDCAGSALKDKEYCHAIRLVALGSGQFARIQSDQLLFIEDVRTDPTADQLAGGGGFRYVYVKQKPAWVLPAVVVENVEGGKTPYTLVDVYPSSTWDKESMTLGSRRSQNGSVLGGFRYRVTLAKEKFEEFDVFVIVNQIEGQLGNWFAVIYCNEAGIGKTLQQVFVELSREDHKFSRDGVTFNAVYGNGKLPRDGRRPLLDKVRRGNHISFILKWSESQYDWTSTPELDGKEVFGSGRIQTTANLLRNRTEMGHLLALTRRMACEVVYDNVDITFSQSVNIVSKLPSKIRTTPPNDWRQNARKDLSTILQRVKEKAPGIQVTGEDGGKLGIFEQYFANRLAVACIKGDVAATTELVQTKLVSVSLECKVSGQSFTDKELCTAFLAFRPIHWAAIFGHTEIVRLLTEGGADRYSKTVTGFTTVHLAALMGHGDLVEYLFDSWTPSELDDLDRLRRGRLNEGPGHLAAAYDRMECGPSLFRGFKRGLVSEYEAGPSAHDARNGLGETPLHRAAAVNNTEAISAITSAFKERAAIVGSDADVTESLDRPDGYGRTPLWHAAATGADDAVRRLLALSAKVDAPDVYGRTPLHIACREGRPTAARILLEAGADANRLTAAPCLSACHFAALAADMECLRLVVRYGGKADLRQMEGLELGAIHVAAANGWLDGVKLLVDEGCDPDTPCSHYVTARGHSQTDAGVNVARFQFNNAMELAVRGGHADVVDYLKDSDLTRSFKSGA